MPRVTVVIPHYEDHALIGETLASIREDEPVEVIVVDDGSPSPEAQAELAELQQRGIRIERREHERPARDESRSERRHHAVRLLPRLRRPAEQRRLGRLGP